MWDCKIDIYGRTYDIKHVTQEQFSKKLKCDLKDVEYDLGAHRYRDSVILIIKEETTATTRLETFIHEVTHAIYNCLGYTQEGKKFDQEFLCNFIPAHFKELNRVVDLYIMYQKEHEE